jgi:hypothetical protein
MEKSIIINSRVRRLQYDGFVKTSTTEHIPFAKKGMIFLPVIVRGKKIGYTRWL